MTNELIGAELDAAVAAALGKPELANWRSALSIALQIGDVEAWLPSTNWAQGGPIIERERILVGRWMGGKWSASVDAEMAGSGSDDVVIGQNWCDGPTPLIAAMRAFVASKK